MLERVWSNAVEGDFTWLCCKKSGRDAMDVRLTFLFSLGSYSKQAGDEDDLILDVSLPDHVHDLVPLQRSPSRFKGKEAHSRLGQSFDEAVVLLDQVIQVFDLPQLDRFGKHPAGFEFSNRLGHYSCTC
jgi:hypothetical protein